MLLSITNFFFTLQGKAQANPYISVTPSNSGLVGVGATLDLLIDVGNTDVSNIAIAKLRPVIDIPLSIVFLDFYQVTFRRPTFHNYI
jgi:hypothetical protein